MSPFRSEQQRKFMYSQHPEIAKRWREESGPQTNLPKKLTMSNLAKRRKSMKNEKGILGIVVAAYMAAGAVVYYSVQHGAVSNVKHLFGF